MIIVKPLRLADELEPTEYICCQSIGEMCDGHRAQLASNLYQAAALGRGGSGGIRNRPL